MGKATELDAQKRILLAHRLALAEADMGEAENYWNGLVDLGRCPRPIWDSVILAIIVVYSRCFIHSESEGKALNKVPIGRIRLFDGEPELRKLHDQILELRMKAVAHSDWEHHRTAYDYEGTDFSQGRMSRTLVRSELTYQLNTRLLVKLFSHVRMVCGTARLAIDRAHHLERQGAQGDEA